jgi:glycerol kinase
VLALDLGTTGVRALVVAADASVRARAYRTLGVAYPAPGRVEQDPDEMWQASVGVMREALGEARADAADLAGIGVVNQRSTAIAWDRTSGRPLAPAIGWQDQRTAERVAWFTERGIPLNTLASATKFEWWSQNDAPEAAAVRDAAAQERLCLGTPDSWLTWNLTGGAEHVTDPGNASCTALYDLASGGWAEVLLGLFGQEAKTLPRLVGTSEVVGETPRDLLGAPVPVAARAGDQQAACFAQGAHTAGAAKLTLGTSAMLDLHTGAETAAPLPGTYPLALWRLADGSTAFCLEGTVITAGSAVEWLVDLGLAPDAAAVDRLAREAGSSGGALFVPALQGLGSPFLRGDARGLITGLTRGTTAAQLARATLDGVAQRCVDVADALDLREQTLRVDGGLGRSDFLVQRIADLSGSEVRRAAETETTALGAAFLAGLATGLFDGPEACRPAEPPRRFEPEWPASKREAARAVWARAIERTLEAAAPA